MCFILIIRCYCLVRNAAINLYHVGQTLYYILLKQYNIPFGCYDEFTFNIIDQNVNFISITEKEEIVLGKDSYQIVPYESPIIDDVLPEVSCDCHYADADAEDDADADADAEADAEDDADADAEDDAEAEADAEAEDDAEYDTGYDDDDNDVKYLSNCKYPLDTESRCSIS